MKFSTILNTNLGDNDISEIEYTLYKSKYLKDDSLTVDNVGKFLYQISGDIPTELLHRNPDKGLGEEAMYEIGHHISKMLGYLGVEEFVPVTYTFSFEERAEYESMLIEDYDDYLPEKGSVIRYRAEHDIENIMRSIKGDLIAIEMFPYNNKNNDKEHFAGDNSLLPKEDGILLCETDLVNDIAVLTNRVDGGKKMIEALDSATILKGSNKTDGRYIFYDALKKYIDRDREISGGISCEDKFSRILDEAKREYPGKFSKDIDERFNDAIRRSEELKKEKKNPKPDERDERDRVR